MTKPAVIPALWARAALVAFFPLNWNEWPNGIEEWLLAVVLSLVVAPFIVLIAAFVAGELPDG